MSQLVLPQIEVIPPEEGGEEYGCEKCGRKHMRVTKILSAVCPKFALVPWAEGCARRGALEVYRADGGLPRTEEALKNRIKDLGLNADSLRDEGGDRGHVVHAYLHRYIESGVVAPLDEYDKRHRPYLQQLAKFLIEYEPEFLCSEVHLANCRLDYAGTTDGVCIIHRQPPRRNKPIDLTGKRCLFDAKTNREGRVYPPDQLYQVAAYELAWRECGGEPNEHQIVIGLGEDKYQVLPSYFDPESFGPLMAFYRSQVEQMNRNPNRRK